VLGNSVLRKASFLVSECCWQLDHTYGPFADAERPQKWKDDADKCFYDISVWQASSMQKLGFKVLGKRRTPLRVPPVLQDRSNKIGNCIYI
jgi:hypothetical protein